MCNTQYYCGGKKLTGDDNDGRYIILWTPRVCYNNNNNSNGRLYVEKKSIGNILFPKQRIIIIPEV